MKVREAHRNSQIKFVCTDSSILVCVLGVEGVIYGACESEPGGWYTDRRINVFPVLVLLRGSQLDWSYIKNR